MTAHRTDCDIIGSSSITYVFLYPRNTKYSRVNLILRYDGEEPKLSWISSKEAVVTVPRVYFLDKEVTRLFGASISYNLVEIK